MKKVLITIASLFVVLVCGCTAEMDLSSINDRLDDLEERVGNLEDMCSQMNTNITSIQTIVSALQSGDYIISIVPVTQDGKTIGYVITFAKNGSITIYNGEDGRDGADGNVGEEVHAPKIGVMQDVDGVYYWTLDGEWLLDDNGKKVPAQGSAGADGEDGDDGQNGKDGVTPQLKIEEDYWWVSYDNGMTWTKLHKAVGGDGASADGAIFKDVLVKENYVYFILVSGETIVVPNLQELDITFDFVPGTICFSGDTIRVPYEIAGADFWTKVTCSADNGWEVYAESGDAGVETGEIVLINHGQFEDVMVGVSVCNINNVVSKTLVFDAANLEVSDYAVFLSNRAAQDRRLEVYYTSNISSYEVVIPEHAKDWITVTSDIESADGYIYTGYINLHFEEFEYEDGYSRTAVLKILAMGKVADSVVVRQNVGEGILMYEDIIDISITSPDICEYFDFKSAHRLIIKNAEYSMTINLFTDFSNNGAGLPIGKFVAGVEGEEKDGTFAPGVVYTSYNGSLHIYELAIEYNSTGLVVYRDGMERVVCQARAGEINISYNEEENYYSIDFDLCDDSGHRFSGECTRLVFPSENAE